MNIVLHVGNLQDSPRHCMVVLPQCENSKYLVIRLYEVVTPFCRKSAHPLSNKKFDDRCPFEFLIEMNNHIKIISCETGMLRILACQNNHEIHNLGSKA